MAASDVNYAQTTMAQTNLAGHKNSFIVRPAMPKDIAHTPELSRINLPTGPR
jgi:hypothetical protein